MKNYAFILGAFICVGLLLSSCQKDTSLAPDNSFSQSLDVQSPDGKIQPKPDDIGPMIDPIFNYPDPFTSETTIQFKVTTATKVSLIVYNELGERMAVLVGQYLPPGDYRVVFDKDCPCGQYRAVLQLGAVEFVEEMTKVYSIHSGLPGFE